MALEFARMSQGDQKPLDRAEAGIKDVMAIVCDYMKVAIEIQPADQFAPAVQLMQLLTDALDLIHDLDNGIGRTSHHSGGMPAD